MAAEPRLCDPPETVACDWCEREALLYDDKPLITWYECDAKHLTGWSKRTGTTSFGDDPDAR